MDHTSAEEKFISILQRMNQLTNYEQRTSVPYTSTQFDLAQFMEALEAIGEPHTQFPSILITGTVGKGSTAYMISAILRSAGYRVGLYTSPHVTDIRERIQVNGELISPGIFTSLAEYLLSTPQFTSLSGKGRRTFFEFLTAIAFLHFAGQRVDMAIVEVGVGGRLDSTNCLEPIMSVFTPIDIDHSHWLGHTLTEIVREKGALIRPECPVISARQYATVRDYLQARAQQLGSPFYYESKDFYYARREDNSRGVHHTIHAGSQSFKRLTLSLAGDFQWQNAAVAIQTALLLESRGYRRLSEGHICKALAHLSWPGRFQLSQLECSNGTQRTMILDSGHNPRAFHQLSKELMRYFPTQRKIAIISISEDKDAGSMVESLLKWAAHVVFTRYEGSRAASPESLAKLCPSSSSVEVDAELLPALNSALQQSTPQDIIVVAGSFFLVSQIMALLKAEFQLTTTTQVAP